MAGLTEGLLAARYPRLYHVAAQGSWKSIERQGLLSTSRLLDVFEVVEPQRTELLAKQRKTSVVIEHPVHGRATLRDQKVLSEKKLASCLSGCDVSTWLRYLNDRVFFWLNEERLVGFMAATEYAGKTQTVLHLDTRALLREHRPNVMLTHMNTGNTRPFAHKRGLDTFRTIEGYPYEERRRLNDYSAIVEFTVAGGVPNVRDYVRRVEHATFEGEERRVLEVILERQLPIGI